MASVLVHRTAPREAVEAQLITISAKYAGWSLDEQADFAAEVRSKTRAFYRAEGSASKTFRADTRTLLKLPLAVQALLKEYAVPRGTAIELARLRNPAVCRHVFVAVIAEGLSYRDTTVLVRAYHWHVDYQSEGAMVPMPDGLAVSVGELAREHPRLPSYPALEFLRGADPSASEPIETAAT